MATTGAHSLRNWTTRYATIGAMVLLVSLLHYNTAMHVHALHGIYRRLYYFPIIIAAFRGGRRAGLLTAVAVCAMYVPHAFGLIGFDPAPSLEKVLEMVLYLAVGLVCGMLVDRQRAALARLQQAQRELVRSERLAAVGKLSAGLAHEIRNPLASIKGSADILASEFPAAHPKSRFLHILQEEAARLNDVLTRFLDFARPAGRTRQPVDLALELREIADLLRAREGAPRVDVDVPPGAWTLAGDPVQLRQLLLNLALNAAAAAGPDGTVSLALERTDAAIALCVTDTGPGFTSEALTALGTPFYSTREGGTGLGLATGMRIARDHGGRLTVDETHSPGARVVVQLPFVSEGA